MTNGIWYRVSFIILQEKTIEMLKNAEINGANQYFTMYFLAKELGYDEIADAIYKNAAEDAAHGGIN